MWEDSEDLGSGRNFLGYVVVLPSALLLLFRRCCCTFFLGSGASLDWVRMLHLLRFERTIGGLGSVAVRKIDHPGRYIDRGVERSWF